MVRRGEFIWSHTTLLCARVATNPAIPDGRLNGNEGRHGVLLRDRAQRVYICLADWWND